MFSVRIACLAITAALLATTAVAAERPLKGPEIATLLNDSTVTGQNINGIWKQYFNVNGETIYLAPEKPPSIGEWNVKGDQFCSQWPPSDHWVCYAVTGDLDAKPRTITWISGGGGATYPGTVQAGKGL